MKRLADKRALVTAAGAGIGRAIAIAFAEQGAHIVATDVDAASIATLPSHGVGETCALDVRDTGAIESLAARLGSVDVLCNCAGFVHHGTALTTTEDDWDYSFDINVKSMRRTISAFLPASLAHGSGSIVNIASGASSLRGIPNRYAYGASKAAVIGLTKSVAAYFIRRGIGCNAICPGTIQSPSLDNRITVLAKEQKRPLDEVRQDFIDRQPIGRLGKAQEVAWMAVYLASDEATYTTGQIHVVDGGFAL